MRVFGLEEVLVGAVLMVLPAVVRADAIMGPMPCPPGARGRASHAGTWCEPHTCTTDDQCGAAAKCREWRVCTRLSDVMPGGLRAEPVESVRMTLVVDTCAPEAACNGEGQAAGLIGTLVEGAPECLVGKHCVGDEQMATAEVVTKQDTQGASGPPVTQRSGCAIGEPVGLGSFGVMMMVVRRRRRV